MIRIGDFSRLSHTPVSTLRYYDEVGLLKPVEVDHFTGYRYYAFEQLARLHRILSLKALGFSLDEITRLLADDLPARQVHAMLQRKRAELREQVQDHHEQLERLAAWLKQIEKENQMIPYTIRAARIESDLPEIVRITNPYETQPVTAEQMREWFQYNPPGRVQQRLVAVNAADAVIAYGGYVHEAYAPDPRYTVWVIVDPAYRGQGIGSDLWNHLSAELKEHGATRLVSDVCDNDAPSLAFAEQRKFSIDEHLFNYALDLSAFDETPFLPAIADLQNEGLRFCALADFADTPETRHKLYDLNTSDMLENSATSVPWTYAGFEEFVLQAPWFRPEGQLLALDGDAWIGMAAVSVFADTHSAHNLYTTVLRPYRGRKIATSLKVLAARYARQKGAQTLLTDSDLRNAPILAIQRKMGYTAQPGKYTLVCEM
jgi:DNA-binding transcriptional MerR regulator